MQVGRPRGRRRRAGVRGALAAAVAAGALAGAFTTARAAQPGEAPPVAFESIPGVPDEWTALLNGYVVDPKTYGPRLIALEREGGAGLPPMFQMAIGDAYLRAGNRRAAEAVFEQTLTQNPGPPYGEFANLGIGMIRMVGGDEDGALDYFVRVAESEEVGAQALGNLGMGAALSASGRFAEAQEAFAETAAISNVDENVRQAGRFGSAMALFGAGDFEAAARAFDEIAKLDPGGTVAQDARYAAARARLEMGDREGGAAALRELVGSCPERSTSRRAPR
ncbi:tetratricopeptide repeat protein, partial [Candidatus Binatia bacterium]|nr:tetratricopeptide repeat protein [Candidatus Binatia bacterium]